MTIMEYTIDISGYHGMGILIGSVQRGFAKQNIAGNGDVTTNMVVESNWDLLGKHGKKTLDSREISTRKSCNYVKYMFWW